MLHSKREIGKSLINQYFLMFMSATEIGLCFSLVTLIRRKMVLKMGYEEGKILDIDLI